jgi:SAM-dependent methyltransferase
MNAIKLALKRRWKKAQNSEEKCYSTRSRYESTEVYAEYLHENFSLDLSFFKDKNILEVRGGGYGMIYFINYSCYKVAIDPLCYRYRDVYADRNDDTNVVTGIGECLPFDSASFDIVLCINVIDHGMNPADSVRELERVLKPEGTLLFMVNTFNLPKAIRSILRIVDRPHPHHLNDKEVLQFLNDSGFKIDFHSIKKSGIGIVLSYIKSGYITPAITNFFAILLGIRRSYYICSKRCDAR